MIRDTAICPKRRRVLLQFFNKNRYALMPIPVIEFGFFDYFANAPAGSGQQSGRAREWSDATPFSCLP
jgi:hypothetical protein